MAQAQDERDQAEGDYSKTNFIDKTCLLMNDWAEPLTKLTQ